MDLGFYGFVPWEVKSLEILPAFTGVILMGRCLPTTYCTIYYGFQWIMKEEQGSLIQQKKIMVAAGIEPLTSR